MKISEQQPDGSFIERDMTPTEVAMLPGNQPLPLEEVQRQLLTAVDKRLNAAAQAKGYDSIITASLRAALPDSPFHAEGVVFGTWMDQTYAACYAELAKVQAGAPIPTEAELMALLPPVPEGLS